MTTQVCSFCAQVKSKSEGCPGKYIVVNGKAYERKKFTEEEAANYNNKRCPECNCKPQRYHHAYCEQEKCPVCGLTLVTCKCIK